jgi:ribosomal protein S18 acetylase RimI-like enzyme
MKLVSATETHLLELMNWFTDQKSCIIWGGPQFRYPFTTATFRQDTRYDDVPSFSFVGDDGELLGFGQYYPRVGRCHLARLAVSPGQRGRGLGEMLVRELCRRGCRDLGTNCCSLFVVAENAPALRLYTRLGFVAVPYPEKTPCVEGHIYMVAPAETADDCQVN